MEKRCESCNTVMEVNQEPTWTTREAFWLRIARWTAIVLIVLVVASFAECNLSRWAALRETEKILEDKSIHVDIQELPTGIKIRKFTRGQSQP